MRPEIDKAALLIVDMQNDFVHPEGGFARIAREVPEAGIDMPFLTSTIPYVQRLADAFRAAGRPVVYIAHMVKPDYSDAQFPYWRIGLHPSASRPFIVEGTWGAQIIDTLQPRAGEHLVIKKGFGGFGNTPLDTILRTMGATNPGIIIGTAAYMSPEQARGRNADRRSDVFSIGCILYEMLT